MSCRCASFGEMHIKELKLLLLYEGLGPCGKRLKLFWFCFLLLLWVGRL
jgi:hypothetical protein